MKDTISINLAKKIRKNILDAILKSNASHIGSAMSIVDILAVLYGHNFVSPHKNQFILSKGHAGIAVYSTLNAISIISNEIFESYYMNGSHLGGHVSHKNVPGITLSTGSLGGGIAVANGICLANKINNINWKTYVIVGDGEIQEGSIWESILFAAHHKLNNLILIIDRNKLQGCGNDFDILNLNNIQSKLLAFNWDTVQINGHNHTEIINALKIEVQKPLCIIADTVKGKGISFMENNNLWHYKNINKSDYEIATKELGYLS
jgi:transketolase